MRLLRCVTVYMPLLASMSELLKLPVAVCTVI